MQFSRYAIYYTCPGGPLAHFAASWLGWDAVKGQAPRAPDLPALPLPRDQITARPRKYGFHATVKPPFRLAEGKTQADLRAAFSEFCERHDAIILDGLRLARLGRFLALVPMGRTDALNALAAETVRDLDIFRAPLSDAELARRRLAPLSPRQDALLREWGYPYVMECFRFHMTLTGGLPKAALAQVQAVLEPHLASLLPGPVGIDALSLMGEREDGRFVLIERNDLGSRLPAL